MSASEQIIQVLDNLAERMGVAIDWTAGNALPYIEQLCTKYVWYAIATAIANVIVCAITAFIFWKIATHFHRKAVKVGYDDDSGCTWAAIAGWIALIVTCIVLFFMTCGTVNTVITGLTFPEKLVLDFVKGLLSAE